MEKLGFINIIKPTNMTSSDVVVKVKKILGIKRVGHLGTLDPAASGVLPIAIGKATKFFDYFLKKDKVYRAIVEFGIETDTLDSFGNITNIMNNIAITEEQLYSVINNYVGEIFQTPPKYSAKKINGKKAYELARINADFELKPKKLNIYNIKIIKNCEKNRFLFEVHCEAGTYIRSLFSDIANDLGCVATTTAIIRIKSGLFGLNSAITLDEFEDKKNIISIEKIFDSFETITVYGALAKKITNGVKVLKAEFIETFGNPKTDEFLILSNGQVVGLYCFKEDKLFPLTFIY